jgi:hypothetical protein
MRLLNESIQNMVQESMSTSDQIEDEGVLRREGEKCMYKIVRGAVVALIEQISREGLEGALLRKQLIYGGLITVFSLEGRLLQVEYAGVRP